MYPCEKSYLSVSLGDSLPLDYCSSLSFTYMNWWLFVQNLQALIKDDIKALYYLSFWEESNGGFPSQTEVNAKSLSVPWSRHLVRNNMGRINYQRQLWERTEYCKRFKGFHL